MRGTLAATVLIGALAGAPAALTAGPAVDGGYHHTRAAANARSRTFEFLAGWTSTGARGTPGSGTSEIKVETQHAFTCWDPELGETPAHENGWCRTGVPQTGALTCDAELVAPTWRRTQAPGEDWSDWERLDQGSCGTALPVLTVEDFRSLPIPAPTLRLQPDGGWVLINKETIVLTDAAPVPLRTTLAGFGVDVEAVPTRFTYDFGDGHTIVTHSPGRPYPDHDTFHEYEQPGTYAVTLTTEWSGRYRVDGDPTWREVTGTATTSTTSATFEAQERRSHLVSGLCTDRPKPPDC